MKTMFIIMIVMLVAGSAFAGNTDTVTISFLVPSYLNVTADAPTLTATVDNDFTDDGVGSVYADPSWNIAANGTGTYAISFQAANSWFFDVASTVSGSYVQSGINGAACRVWRQLNMNDDGPGTISCTVLLTATAD